MSSWATAVAANPRPPSSKPTAIIPRSAVIRIACLPFSFIGLPWILCDGELGRVTGLRSPCQPAEFPPPRRASGAKCRETDWLRPGAAFRRRRGRNRGPGTLWALPPIGWAARPTPAGLRAADGQAGTVKGFRGGILVAWDCDGVVR